MPCPSILQHHKLLFAAIYEFASLIRIFRDITQHMQGFLFVQHIGAFNQSGQKFPSNSPVTSCDDAVRNEDTFPDIPFK